MADRVISVTLKAQVGDYIAGMKRAKTSTTDTENASKKLGDTAKTSAEKQHQAASTISNGLLGIGAVAGAGLGVAIKHYADFDKAMSSVQAATHETSSNMDLLRAAAIKAGADTQYSATDAANAITELSKAGVSTTNILKGGLSGALSLAAAGQIDVGQAAEDAASAMTQFGLKGSQIPHVADLLAAGAGKAQGEVGDLSLALKQGGLVSAQFGLSIDDTVGTLSAFASAGLLGSDAGTSLKQMFLQLANPSKQAQQEMKQLGISAYDAQGQFVGISKFAQVLQDKLKNLTPQQRQSAEAIIFGSDAIRAANVLYTNGQKGIQGWIDKVNDTGYASITARDKTDNLRGDIERLGGSFDSAIIKGGKGANDVLRTLTAGAEGLVNQIGALDPKVLGAGVAFSAIVTAGGLAAGSTLKIVTAVKDAKKAIADLGTAGKALTVGGGLFGLALAGAGVAFSIYERKQQESKKYVDDLTDSINKQSYALTAQSTSIIAQKLAQDGASAKAKDLGINFDLVTRAASGNSDALGQVNTALDAIINKPTPGGGYAKVLTQQQVEARKLKGSLNDSSGAVAKAIDQAKIQNALNKDQGNIQQQLAGQLGITTGKQQAAGASAKVSEAATKLLNATESATVKTYQDEIDKLNKLTAARYQAAGNVLSERDALRSYQSALDGVVASTKQNGHSLDTNTEKGRTNQAALDAVAQAANQYTQSLIALGHQNLAAGAAEQSRSKLSALAQKQFGLTKSAADAYAKSVISIPPQKTTKITLDANNAKAAYNDYHQRLGDLPKTVTTNAVANTGKAKANIYDFSSQVTHIPRSPEVTVTAHTGYATAAVRGFATTANTLLDGIQNRTVSFAVRTGYQASASHQGHTKLATGGSVWGAGSATSDSIPAMLSNGEFVVRSVQAMKYRGMLEDLNAGRNGFASGGSVGLTVAGNMPSQAVVNAYGEQIAKTIQALATKAFANLSSSGFNPGLAGALAFAKSQAGKPYVWGASGPNGYDCSGFQSAVVNVALGRSPYHRDFATGSMGSSSLLAPGLGAYSLGYFTGNPGHTAGTINGVNIESSGGRGVHFGPGARGATDPLFNRRVHLKGFAVGGRVSTPQGDAPFDLIDPQGRNYDPKFAAILELLKKRQGMSGGGPVRGPGTGRSDSVPAWLSNGEFVVNARATQANLPLLHAINGYASGGYVNQVSGSGFVAGGRLVDISSLLRVMNMTFNALAGIDWAGTLKRMQDASAAAAASKQVLARANAQVGRDQSGVKSATADLYQVMRQQVPSEVIDLARTKAENAKANSLYANQNRVLAEIRERQRALNKIPAHAEKDPKAPTLRLLSGDTPYTQKQNATRQAAYAKELAAYKVAKAKYDTDQQSYGTAIKSRKVILDQIAALKKQELSQKTINKLSKQAGDAAANPLIAKQKREQAALKVAQSRVDAANAKLKKSTDAQTKASDAYTTATQKATDATQAHKDAIAALQEQQQAAVQAAQGYASAVTQGTGLADLFGDSLSAKGLVQSLAQKIAGLKKFAGQITQLRKLGLSAELLQQIVNAGPDTGGDMATSLLANKATIKQLNAEQAQLNSIANQIGAGQANQDYGFTVPGATGGSKVTVKAPHIVKRPVAVHRPTYVRPAPVATYHGPQGLDSRSITLNQTNYTTDPEALASRAVAKLRTAGGI